MSSISSELIHFGPFEVTNQVFYKAPLCYALVNIKPILPGHVLVVPYRRVQHLVDLTTDEVTDLFTTVQRVQKMLAKYYSVDSMNIAIQDGPDSGQTVPHVHCHIIPRARGNTEGDGIYDRLQSEQGNIGGGLWDQRRPIPIGKFPNLEDDNRKPRSAEEMSREASLFNAEMASIEN